MEQDIIIYISTAKMLVGIGAIIAATWIVARKFGHIETKIETFDIRLTGIESKSSGSLQTQSPIQLTEKGNRILEGSGLKAYIDQETENLYKSVCSGKMDTPYDVQENVFGFFGEYVFPSETENRLKTFAYNEGVSFEVVKRIGAVYFRDICLTKKNFAVEDIDKKQA